MVVSALVCLVFLVLSLFVILREWEIWPLTPYPMFSFYADPEKVKVYCLDLETREGVKHRWRPEFPNYEEMLRSQIRSFLNHGGLENARLRKVFFRWLLIYIGMMGSNSEFQRVEVVEREAVFDSPSRFALRDRVLFSFSMKELIQEAIIDVAV